MSRLTTFAALALLAVTHPAGRAQEKSVKPGINDPFQNPDAKKYEATFESESREIFTQRKEILKAVGLKPGQAVADVGAGTGLFVRLFAEEVGEKGRVFAVDIAEKFLDRIKARTTEAGVKNVTTVLCKPHSAELAAGSIDVAFICDTYHHFEFPLRTMASIHAALKPGGRVVLIDFQRIPGTSREFILGHVRAGQEVFEKEIAEVGFRKVTEEKELGLKENYFVVFEKVEPAKAVFPVVAGYGGVVPLPAAVEQPAKGTRVVIDATGGAKGRGQPAAGLVRAATLLNLAGAAGLKPGEVEVVVVLHGDATAAALTDEAAKAKTGQPNESGELIERLTKAGARVLVCGQSVERKGYDPRAVRPGVTVAASAITAVANLQAKGFVLVSAPGQ
jgi:ubiquinone/menaquinone biosynthesis C-methylase UbiE/intracellular sulfur oxidation DsrE/DsrF family protein